MLRKIVQFIATVAQNGYLAFPFTRNIYQGGLKGYCTPGLNCHSCPAATFACPLGTLQLFASGARSAIEYATWQLGLTVSGFLMAVALIFGRLSCGWICPFGLLQELLYKIPLVKLKVWSALEWLRYPVLFILVLALPYLSDGAMGATFCKYLCPAGTLEASGLLLIMPELREQLGSLYYWKVGVLALFLGWFVVSYRPFCRVGCPLGLILGWFNRASLVSISHDDVICEECGDCNQCCEMGVDPREADKSPGCIRCFDCATKKCPNHALKITVAGREFFL